MRLTFGVFLAWAAAAQPPSYTFHDFDVPGATSTGASGVNNGGQIVGGYSNRDGTIHCFLRSADGASYTTIEAPGALPNTTSCSGINNLGQIVGGFRDATGFHGFIRSAEGEFTVFTPGPLASVGGINVRGEVVGPYTDPVNGGNGFLRHADGSMESIRAPFFGDTCRLPSMIRA